MNTQFFKKIGFKSSSSNSKTHSGKKKTKTPTTEKASTKIKRKNKNAKVIRYKDPVITLREKLKKTCYNYKPYLIILGHADLISAEQIQELKDDYPKPIGIKDITVERNFYGRQIDSFEEKVVIKGIDDKKFNAIFIRAPIIREVGKNVEVLSILNNEIIAARQDKIFVTSFHPELTEDSRVHKYFLSMC